MCEEETQVMQSSSAYGHFITPYRDFKTLQICPSVGQMTPACAPGCRLLASSPCCRQVAGAACWPVAQVVDCKSNAYTLVAARLHNRPAATHLLTHRATSGLQLGRQVRSQLLPSPADCQLPMSWPTSGFCHPAAHLPQPAQHIRQRHEGLVNQG